MVYKEFQDLKLSALGMGAMRLPVTEGDEVAVARRMLDKYKQLSKEYYNVEKTN